MTRAVTTMFTLLSSVTFMLFAAQSCNVSEPHPIISWTPFELADSVSPLEEKSATVTFRSTTNLSGLSVMVGPELRPYITAAPSQLGSLSAGTPVTLNLRITAGASAPLGEVTGEISLSSLSDPGNPYAHPLPVSLRIGKLFRLGSFSMLYPTFGRTSEVLVSTQGNVTRIDVRLIAATGGQAISQFGLILSQNTGRVSLTDWLQQNVDPAGTLLSSGSLGLQTLSNGVPVLERLGPVPAAFLDEYGPVADFYAISPAGDIILILAQSQENEFDLLGYSETARHLMLLDVLRNIKFSL